VDRVQAAFANPAGEIEHRRTGRAPSACQAAGLLAAFCASALLLLMPAHATSPPDLKVEQSATAPVKAPEEASPQAFPMEEFLDRLMAAESGGRLRRKNPRSTALGPFQFVESTFLFVVDKHFRSEVAGLTKQQVLARRTDMAFARRAARAYVHDLISALAAKDLPASPVNLRIAFLVGPSAAIRLLGAPPDEPLTSVLSADAIAANPFMSGVTIAQLVQKAAVEVGGTAETERLGPSMGAPAVKAASSKSEPASTLVALETAPSSTSVVSKSEPPGTAIDRPIDLQNEPMATSAEPPSSMICQIGLASCRRWIALQERKTGPSMRSAER
jgi:hypothetical protein